MRIAPFLVIAGTLTLFFAGCAKKVDCTTFCEREAQCVADIVVALGVKTADQMKGYKDDEKKFLADGQRTRCTTSCNDPNKPSQVDEKWNKCLELTDCKAFADCVYKQK